MLLEEDFHMNPIRQPFPIAKWLLALACFCLFSIMQTGCATIETRGGDSSGEIHSTFPSTHHFESQLSSPSPLHGQVSDQGSAIILIVIIVPCMIADLGTALVSDIIIWPWDMYSVSEHAKKEEQELEERLRKMQNGNSRAPAGLADGHSQP
jgi:hypothetical protein